ncbi:guanine deaminase [Luteitalea pratensis]|uniref:Guanine deaminase n=1 Tax=Luteitalea pratensis TaxID=1855912 RepID=A0A143PJ02_LUTPR|nr:amidohydrolase family protein [Luteitalea pratensis]AMY08058.1 guanine deaminase [Luteitalea pratensis]
MTARRTRQHAGKRSDDACTSGVSRRALLAGGLAGAGVMLARRTAGAWLSGQGAPGTATVIEAPRLFDGLRIAVTDGARVVIRDGSIVAAGRAVDVAAPAGATVTRADDATVLPGLIDLHFHIEEDPAMALRQLAHGITAFRDPGEWIEVHEPLRRRIKEEALPGPRLFLTGPHIDGEGPAYPADSVVARDPEEARRQVHRAVDQGATAIKIYFRLPLASALAVIEACQARGVPSTAHLEILDARELIEAGLTGLEHITSFGTSVASPMQAERYRQAVLANNATRSDGRYALFADADLDGPEARRLYEIVTRKRPFVDATLAVFEVQPADTLPKGSTLSAATRVEGFRKMQMLTRRLHEHGARIVMGGHTEVPHAGRGEAPWRELELLTTAGLSASAALTAATSTAAAFLGKGGADLGVIRPGAAADLLVVNGQPDTDISAIRRTRVVMAAGRLVDLARLGTL